MKDINGFINDKVNVAMKKNGSIYIGNIPDDNLEHFKIIIDATTLLEMIRGVIKNGTCISIGHCTDAANGQIVIGHFDNPLNPENPKYAALTEEQLEFKGQLTRIYDPHLVDHKEYMSHPGHPCEF